MQYCYFKFILVVLSVLCSSCTGYIKGDLDYAMLDENILFSIEEGSLQESYKDKVRYGEANIRCGNNSYKVLYEYDIQENSSSTEVMIYATGFTFGLLPLYSTNNIEFTMIVLHEDKVLFREKIDARAHWFYGWLLAWWLGKTPSKNQLKWDEGSGVSGALYRGAYERSLFRLHRILREKGKLSKLCGS